MFVPRVECITTPFEGGRLFVGIAWRYVGGLELASLPQVGSSWTALARVAAMALIAGGCAGSSAGGPQSAPMHSPAFTQVDNRQSRCARATWAPRASIVTHSSELGVHVSAKQVTRGSDLGMQVTAHLQSLDGNAHDVIIEASRASVGTMVRPGFSSAACVPGSLNGQHSDNGLKRRVLVPATGVVSIQYDVVSVGMDCPGGEVYTDLNPSIVHADKTVTRLEGITVELQLLHAGQAEIALHPADWISPLCTPDIDECCG